MQMTSRASAMSRPSVPDRVMFKFREELVGKRFLSVSGGSGRLRLNKISDWGWRTGVIRASTHEDCHDCELQVKNLFVKISRLIVRSARACVFLSSLTSQVDNGTFHSVPAAVRYSMAQMLHRSRFFASDSPEN